jgi:hypothetical protein
MNVVAIGGKANAPLRDGVDSVVDDPTNLELLHQGSEARSRVNQERLSSPEILSDFVGERQPPVTHRRY